MIYAPESWHINDTYSKTEFCTILVCNIFDKNANVATTTMMNLKKKKIFGYFGTLSKLRNMAASF